MKIKILNTGVISNSEGIKISTVDIEIIEGDKLLSNTKFKSIVGNMKFTLISVGRYNPSITKKYPCIIDIDNKVDLKTFKNKVFVVE